MNIAVIGSGSWGTAIAQLLGNAGHSVFLQARKQAVVDSINVNHINPNYLSHIQLSDNINASMSYEAVLKEAQSVVVATPSPYLRKTVEAFSGFIGKDLPVINLSKGVEAETGNLASDILTEILGTSSRIAVLSGPTHAEEVIREIPSAAVCASENEDTANFFADLFSTPFFRTYTSLDIVGVELCAAFKNVIAIAVGISYGLGFGDNTAAMLITRGIAEMSRMVVACGGDALTCMGLAGAGDMVVTCMSEHSRNRRFGQYYVARGKTLADFEADTHMVVEGAQACKTLQTLEVRYKVELPITNSVRRIVWQGANPSDEARSLISRPLVEEFYGI